MSVCLLLIRHGETLWNRERRFQGFADVPLSERGEEQARALGTTLERVPLSGVYCSDLRRAIETAERIAEPHRISVQPDPRLREMNQGSLEGKGLQDLVREHPGLLERWMADPADIPMPGGESLRSAQSRAWEAILEIIEKHRDGTAAVVGHNLCLITVICKAIGLDLVHFRSLRIENGSISEILFTGQGPVLARINDIKHLAGR
ncbi:MAG: histidine phosphatase family protein [bacterium]